MTELSPTNTKIIREGFVAVYDHKQWGIGYIKSESCANGFTNKPGTEHIYNDIENARSDCRSIEKMKNYHGNGQVLFGTVRVMHYIERVNLTSCEDEAVVNDIIAQRVLNKLSTNERNAVEIYMNREK